MRRSMLRSIASLSAVVPVVLLAAACSSDDSSETKGRPLPDCTVGGTAGTSGEQGGSGGTPHDGEGGEAGEAPEAGSGGVGGGSSGGSGGSGSTDLPPAKYGFFPKTVSLEDAEEAYTTWKDKYVVDCGTTGIRVNTSEAGETLAEAIGFGALLAVAWDDKETFDGIATYYRKAGKASDALKGTTLGLMGWYMGPDACDLGTVYPGSSIGSDLNVAMALLQAECRWGGGEYKKSAEKILTSIREAATREVEGKTVLLPSDGLGSDSVCASPSYSAPAFYRVFAKAFEDDADFWNKFADDSYDVILPASKTVTKLAPDWAPFSSEPCPSADGYVGYDGIRTGWRVATDYVWFGTEAAKKWMDASTGYLEEEVGTAEFMNVKDGFFADGEGMLIALGLGNSAFVGSFAVGAMATSQDVSDSFHEAFIDIPRANDNSYYSDTGRAIYLLLSVNKFSPGCY